MAEAPRCPSTGQPMVRGVRPVEISYRGRSKTVEMPGWFSEATDESIHSREDMSVSDFELTTLKAESHGLAGPEEIKALRARLGLTRTEADDAIGEEPGSFERYESGRRLVSRPTSHLLRLLSRHPDEIERFRTESRDVAGRPPIAASLAD